MATFAFDFYGASKPITCDVSGLARSATFVVGRESTQIDNTTDLYRDAIVTCDGITGHAVTAPVAGQKINVYVWGSDVSLATTSIDTLVGTDGTRTLAHAAVLDALKLGGSSTVTDVSPVGLKYYIAPFSVAALFGN